MSSQAKIAANRANGRKSRGPRTRAGKSKTRRNALRHGLAAISRNRPEIYAEIEPIATAICGGATDPLLFEQGLIIAENAFVLRCVQAERIAAVERCRDAAVTALATGDLGFAQAQARLARAKLAYEMRLQTNTQPSASEGSASDASAPEGSASDASALEASRSEASGIGSPRSGNPRSRHRRPVDTAQMRWRQRREGLAAQARVTSMRQRDEFEAMRAATPDLDRLERYRRRAWSRVRRGIRRFVEIEQHASGARARRPRHRRAQPVSSLKFK